MPSPHGGAAWWEALFVDHLTLSPPLPDDKIEQIFEPFARLDESRSADIATINLPESDRSRERSPGALRSGTPLGIALLLVSLP